MLKFKLLNISVCNNYCTVVNILERNLFFSNPVFGECYRQMIKCCDDAHTQWPNYCSGFKRIVNTKDVLLSVPVKVVLESSIYDPFGHDLPFWVEVNEEEKGRIMLVSQDPLRRLSCPGYITFSSPFGIHSLDYRGNRLTTQIVEVIIKKGYSVYLTDIYKLYAMRRGVKVSFMPKLFYDILSAEIDFFKPTSIIGFGKIPQNALKGIYPSKGVPHPNARLDKAFLRMKGYARKVDYLVDEITK